MNVKNKYRNNYNTLEPSFHWQVSSVRTRSVFQQFLPDALASSSLQGLHFFDITGAGTGLSVCKVFLTQQSSEELERKEFAIVWLVGGTVFFLLDIHRADEAEEDRKHD